MKTESLDLLEKSSLPPDQARAILKAMESELSAYGRDLATKPDVQAVKADVLAVKSELKGELASLRSELKGELAVLRSEWKGELAAVKGEVLGEIKGLRISLRWIYGFWIVQLGALYGLLHH